MAQIQIGTKGRVGFHKQTAYDTIYATDADFHYFPYINCTLGVVQGAGQLPAETGGSALPRGYHKTGTFAAGALDLVPRLENRFGWLLEAVLGDASYYADQNIAQVEAAAGATVGCYTHLFGFVDGDDFEVPYLTAHKLLPHTTATSEVGEIYQDIHMSMLRIDVAPLSYVRAHLEMLGRSNPSTVFDINPGWAMPTYDTDDTFMVTSCAGSVKLSASTGVPGTLTAFDCGATSISIVNNLLPPPQSAIIGTMHHKDHPVLSRNIIINTVIYVDDYDLYVQVFGAAADPVVDTGISCVPLDGDFDLSLESAADIGATGEKYAMRILTSNQNVKWTARPINPLPNQPIVLMMTGTVINTDSARDFKLYVQNSKASTY